MRLLAVHLLTIRSGEVYLHHFWLLVLIAFLAFGMAAGSKR